MSEHPNTVSTPVIPTSAIPSWDTQKVWFVGAGPGDKELITLKGYRLLQQAQVVIYAGSLINTELLAYCSPKRNVTTVRA